MKAYRKNRILRAAALGMGILLALMSVWASAACRRKADDLLTDITTTAATTAPDTTQEPVTTEKAATDAPETTIGTPETTINNAPQITPKTVITTPPAVTTKPPAAMQGVEQQVVALVNQARRQNGLGELSVNDKLADVARIKAEDMATNRYFSHTSPTYGSPFDMMKRFGISYRTAGENIAMGQTTAQQVFDGWMNSPGHRANILNPSFTQIGVGYSPNGHYWVQMFIG